MRIIQLSDIHLSKDNIENLKNYYLSALIKDLAFFHGSIPIDAILFTGDLVDKGGNSLGENPYEYFQKEILFPIKEALGLTSNQILFIPGNHDINREFIDKYSEHYLCEKLDKDLANQEILALRNEFTSVNKRIQKFKTFEQQFHSDNSNYAFSNNESTVIIEEAGKKIGLALINDSWRCSSSLKQDQHFIGYNQLFNAKQRFSKEKTLLNIAVFHHPLNLINLSESEEIENILKSQGFDIAFFGHSHKHEAKSTISAIGGYLTINGRSAFSNTIETTSQFQPGYNILDLNLDTKVYTLYARKFIRTNGYRFDSDTESIPGGKETSSLPNKTSYYSLAKSEESNNDDSDLPISYSADVHRIVNLLIGKSLYPEPYTFVRELIQNSVDACNRVRIKQTHIKLRIILNINSKENFIEVTDEGDGMTKSIIKNHFSVIGKSISQEFNDSTGNFNLISQFGIGFISTFIVAEKVIINTKNDDDKQIMFEINDVFKGFNYIKPSNDDVMMKSGTTIRVYLKKGYDARSALQHVGIYCRHIENLELYVDSKPIPINESWNLEGSNFQIELNSEKHESKFGISVNPRPLIATNSGFLISYNPDAIIPFKFPIIIGGEVNFRPKGIDFDMSRTNIMVSPKSENFRKEISITLRKLFRDALESSDPNLVNSVLNYLHYYLQYYDSNNAQIQDSYADFYSKKELISLCSEYTTVPYQGIPLTLNKIFNSSIPKSLGKIFYVNSQSITDYQTIVIQYLENQGYLVIKNKSYNVIFRDTPQVVTLMNVIQQIASSHGIQTFEIAQVQAEVLKDMKMDKTMFHEKLQKNIHQIEARYSVTIEIGKFSKLSKPSVRNSNHIFLNFDHETFQSLLKNIDIPDDIFEIYLLGLLGLQLRFR